MRAFALMCAAALCATAADKRVIFPPGAKTVGPYSPGILAGDFLYVSGQGVKAPDGKVAASFEDQVGQCLENIKTIVEAAGLTMEHVVYAQAYLTDMSKQDAVSRAMARYFTGTPPASAFLGVHRLPTDTPVEINAVAIRDLARKKGVTGSKTTGILAGDRLYISGAMGIDPATGKAPDDPAAQVRLALDAFHGVLAAAGMDYRNVVFVNPYLTKKVPMDVMNREYASRFEFGNTPARATIEVADLPQGAGIEFTGVAVADADVSRRKAVRPKNMKPSPTASPCVFAGDTFYCSAKSGFIPGPNLGIYSADVETQVRQTMRNLLDGLEEAGLDFSNVVASVVYLDNLDEFTNMNGIYAQYFSGQPPTRTTVQPLAPVERKRGPKGEFPMLEQISIIAVR